METIDRAEVSGILVLGVSGEIDASLARVLAEHLRDALAGTPRQLVVDLSELRFMDSTGVHAILDIQRVIEAYGGQLAVVTGPTRIHDVFRLTGTHATVSLHPTREDAVAALHRRILEPG